MKISFYKAFLCFSLLLLSSAVYAQSDKVVKIPLQGVDDEFINNEEDPKRGVDIENVLPIVLYDALNENFIIVSPQVTFESVAYYIVDELGFVQHHGEMTLRKDDEVELHLPQLSIGTYKIVLDFSGDCFQGEFEVEQ